MHENASDKDRSHGIISFWVAVAVAVGVWVCVHVYEVHHVSIIAYINFPLHFWFIEKCGVFTQMPYSYGVHAQFLLCTCTFLCVHFHVRGFVLFLKCCSWRARVQAHVCQQTWMKISGNCTWYNHIMCDVFQKMWFCVCKMWVHTGCPTINEIERAHQRNTACSRKGLVQSGAS